MITYKADNNKSHRASCSRDHGRPSAEEGEQYSEPEGGIKAHHGTDAGNDAEADDFWDDGERGDKAGEDIAADVAEPLLFFLL